MENTDYKIKISSKHKIFDLHIRETFRYRDLIFLFVKRNFVTGYKQTLLGPLWVIINPLVSTFVYTIIFGGLAGLPTSDIAGNVLIPSFLFYMSGNICWSYFSSTLSATSETFLANSGTMGKVYYPRLVAPVSTAFSNLISFGIQMGLYLIAWLFYFIKGNSGIVISPWLLMIPVCIIQMMMLSVGIGIVVSSMTTKYRDLTKAVSLFVTLWRYASPVAYGLQLVPEKWLGLYMLNPFSDILTTFRYALFGTGYFNGIYYLISWIFTFAVFFIGLIMFSKIERTFMDTI